jgi:hypothetical protein
MVWILFINLKNFLQSGPLPTLQEKETHLSRIKQTKPFGFPSLKKPRHIIDMSTNGQLVFTDVDKITFKGVGNTSNAVVDTVTGKIGVGIDSPDANLHVLGNSYVSTNLELGGTLIMGTVNVSAHHSLEAVTAEGNTTPVTVEFSNATTGIVTTGNVEVGGELTASGNINMLHTANTASIKLNSNVVTEFPRSKKLIKYPRVALTSASYNAYEGGYKVTVSGFVNSTNHPWKAFNGIDYEVGMLLSGLNYDTNGNANTSGTTASRLSASDSTPYGEWLKLELPNKIKLDKYVFTSRNHATHWAQSVEAGQVWGSNNDSNWVHLHTFTNSGFTGESQSAYFDVQTDNYYKYYAFIVTKTFAAGSDYYLCVPELKYYGVPEYDPQADGVDVTVKSYPNVPNTDWLDVYYDAKGLTNGSVTTVSDLKPSSLGTALNSSSTNNITVSDDAFVFNGTDSYIKIDDLTNPSGAWTHSVVAWINSSDLGNFDLTWIGDVDSATTRQSFSFHTSGQALTMGISASNVQFRFFSPLVKDKWHHVVYTFSGGAAGSGSTAYKVFVDGVEGYKTGGVGGGTLNLPAQTALWIGRNLGGSNHFKGKIANFRIFNRALSQDEIYQLYAYQKEDFGHGDLSMTLKAGRLGIGTSEPRAALDVRGDIYGGCPVFFRARKTTDTFGGTDPIIWNETMVNKGGGYDTTTGKFTAPISGYYEFIYGGVSGRSDWSAEMFAKKNNVKIDGSGAYTAGGGNHWARSLMNTVILELNQGDVFHLYLQTGNQDMYGGSAYSYNFFSGKYLSN